MNTNISSKGSVENLGDAIALHQAGELEEAEALYRRALDSNPKNADALHLLGVIAHQTGDHERALELIDRAIKLSPRSARFHNNRGETLRALGKTEDAIASYRRAIELQPDDIDAQINLGNVLQSSGRLKDAIGTLRKALAVDSDSVEALYNLGNALKVDGRLEEAANAYRKAISINPGIPHVHGNLASVLLAQNRPDEAVTCYLRAIDVDPSFAEAHASLGLIAVDQGRLEDAIGHYEKSLIIRRAPDGKHAGTASITTTRAKLTHDIEQLRYLRDRGLLGEEHRHTVDNYEKVLEALAPAFEKHFLASVPPDIRRRMESTYNRLLHYVPPGALEGPAINPNLNNDAITEDYERNAPGITFVDNFLTREALDGLRRFCLESTIWFKCDYEYGYFAAVMDEGFLCPLLAQIASELPLKLPGIFKDHRLTQMWAFKYDHYFPGGVGMHADFAAVNVNFWITPDSANRSPESGGLIVWDKQAPLDWSFEAYNVDQEAIGKFLKESNAKPTKIPYRSNRSVIFNSDLFHRTDELDFAPGYENRRINITLLYGTREHGRKPAR